MTTTRKAKQIAAEFSDWLEFWYDRRQRLWCITDVRMNAASDYLSPGWLADFTEGKLRDYLRTCAEEIAEVNDIPAPGAITDAEIEALGRDLSLHLNLDHDRTIYLATMLLRIARGDLKADSGVSGLVDELRGYCTPIPADLMPDGSNARGYVCPVCDELVTDDAGEYKQVPRHHPKHPPLYSLCHKHCHPDREVLS